MSTLFTSNKSKNLLNREGQAYYFGQIMSDAEEAEYFHHFLNKIAWKNDEAIIFGKHIVTKRKVAWYGDEEFEYTYSKITRKAIPWSPELLKLKKICERITGSTFNSCLLNLYHDGTEGMAWHSDDEKMLKENGTIASVSFGAQRKFGFKHKTSKETFYLELEPGSLLTMEGTTQQHWLHRLPPTKKIKTPRINLTFRWIIS